MTIHEERPPRRDRSFFHILQPPPCHTAPTLTG